MRSYSRKCCWLIVKTRVGVLKFPIRKLSVYKKVIFICIYSQLCICDRAHYEIKRGACREILNLYQNGPLSFLFYFSVTVSAFTLAEALRQLSSGKCLRQADLSFIPDLLCSAGKVQFSAPCSVLFCYPIFQNLYRCVAKVPSRWVEAFETVHSERYIIVQRVVSIVHSQKPNSGTQQCRL